MIHASRKLPPIERFEVFMCASELRKHFGPISLSRNFTGANQALIKLDSLMLFLRALGGSAETC